MEPRNLYTYYGKMAKDDLQQTGPPHLQPNQNSVFNQDEPTMTGQQPAPWTYPPIRPDEPTVMDVFNTVEMPDFHHHGAVAPATMEDFFDVPARATLPTTTSNVAGTNDAPSLDDAFQPDQERDTRVMVGLLESILSVLASLLYVDGLTRFAQQTPALDRSALHKGVATTLLPLKAGLQNLLMLLESQYLFYLPHVTPEKEPSERRRQAYDALGEAGALTCELGEMVRQCEIGGWMSEMMEPSGITGGGGWKKGEALQRLVETHAKLLALRRPAAGENAGWELWKSYVADT